MIPFAKNFSIKKILTINSHSSTQEDLTQDNERSSAGVRLPKIEGVRNSTILTKIQPRNSPNQEALDEPSGRFLSFQDKAQGFLDKLKDKMKKQHSHGMKPSEKFIELKRRASQIDESRNTEKKQEQEVMTFAKD